MNPRLIDNSTAIPYFDTINSLITIQELDNQIAKNGEDYYSFTIDKDNANNFNLTFRKSDYGTPVNLKLIIVLLGVIYGDDAIIISHIDGPGGLTRIGTHTLG